MAEKKSADRKRCASWGETAAGAVAAGALPLMLAAALGAGGLPAAGDARAESTAVEQRAALKALWGRGDAPHASQRVVVGPAGPGSPWRHPAVRFPGPWRDNFAAGRLHPPAGR